MVQGQNMHEFKKKFNRRFIYFSCKGKWFCYYSTAL